MNQSVDPLLSFFVEHWGWALMLTGSVVTFSAPVAQAAIEPSLIFGYSLKEWLGMFCMSIGTIDLILKWIPRGKKDE